jgi:hypothetical protein
VRSLVVDRHGGSVTFTTEEGSGTTFLVRLPLPAPTSPVAPPSAAAGPASGDAGDTVSGAAAGRGTAR